MERALDGELLVYDRERHRAHCLNPTAAFVFTRCDGVRSVQDLQDEVARELGVADAGPLVELALDRLAKARLLEGPAPAPARMSRREVLRSLKVAAALLPVVASLTAPTPLSAASSVKTLDCTLKLPPCPNLPCSDSPGQFCRQVLLVCKCQ